MASFSIEEFVGNGVLKELIPKLLEEGWDDVPTLKIMNLEDMDAINMTQEQKVSYLQTRLFILSFAGTKFIFIIYFHISVFSFSIIIPLYVTNKYKFTKSCILVCVSFLLFTLGCTGNQVIPARACFDAIWRYS